MKVVSMSGSLRENVGKKDAKKLRAQDMVPCVMYGGEEQLHFAVETSQFKDVVFTPEICFINIEFGDRQKRAILQDIQYHPVSDAILHADFVEIFEDKPIVMYVPVFTKGASKGILAGGKLSVKIRKLKIKALPDKMPESITLDITKLGIGDSIKVRDIQTEDYELLDPARSVVVAVTVTRVAVTGDFDEEEEGEEGAAEGEGGEAPAAEAPAAE